VVTLSAIFTPNQPPEQIRPVAAAAEAAGMTTPTWSGSSRC